MLLRQHRRRHEHRRLLAAHHGFERRANPYLGFSEANIPADQPVHWFGPFHVTFGLDDGPHLIRRFLIDERAFELALPRRIHAERMSRL